MFIIMFTGLFVCLFVLQQKAATPPPSPPLPESCEKEFGGMDASLQSLQKAAVDRLQLRAPRAVFVPDVFGIS